MFCCCCCCCFNCNENDENIPRNNQIPNQVQRKNNIKCNICCFDSLADCCFCCCRNINRAENLCCYCCSGSTLCNCCSNITQKIYQILYIISNGCILIFLLTTLTIISWENFPKINLTLFIIISVIVLACLILSILLFCFTIQIETNVYIKSSINQVKIIGFILTIICLVFCVIEEIFLSVNIAQARDAYPCNGGISNDVGFFAYSKRVNNNNRLLSTTKNHECYQNFVTPILYGLSYFTLTFIEIIYFIGCFFWFYGTDSCCNYNNYNNGPYQNNNNVYQNNQPVNTIPSANVNNPQIIIVQQGNNIQNPNIIYPQQPNYNQNYVYNNENYAYNIGQNPYLQEQNQDLNSKGGFLENMKNKVKNFINGN